MKFSDFLTRARYHDLGIYQEFFRRLDVEHQMAVALRVGFPVYVGLALNRPRCDFSERDRLVLNLLRPHLAQAHRNAEAVAQLLDQRALAERGLEHLNVGVVALTPAGGIQLATPQARRLIAEYFGAARRWPDALPDELARWLCLTTSALDSDASVAVPQAPLIVERPGKRLVVRLLADESRRLMLLHEQHASLPRAALEALGLTRREAEVLAWVAEGKSDAAIATILGLSVRTVNKHLEHIYAKLGVESRSAAAARAYQAAGMTGGPDLTRES